MSEIPEDIREKARELVMFLEAMPSEGNIAGAAAALLAERERCAELAIKAHAKPPKDGMTQAEAYRYAVEHGKEIADEIRNNT